MAFLDLTESMVARLIPKMGPQSKFLKFLRKLREEIQRDKVGYLFIVPSINSYRYFRIVNQIDLLKYNYTIRHFQTVTRK